MVQKSSNTDILTRSFSGTSLLSFLTFTSNGPSPPNGIFSLKGSPTSNFWSRISFPMLGGADITRKSSMIRHTNQDHTV